LLGREITAAGNRLWWWGLEPRLLEDIHDR